MIPAFSLNEDGVMDIAIDGEGKVLVKCDICDTTIASAYLEELSLPLKTEMFKSPDPYHGAPAPWQPGLDWGSMFCPVCHNKFAIFPGHRIKTSRGYYDVPERKTEKTMQDRAEVARLVHTQEAAGSTPAPASINEAKPSGPSCPVCHEACGTLSVLEAHLNRHKEDGMAGKKKDKAGKKGKGGKK